MQGRLGGKGEGNADGGFDYIMIIMIILLGGLI